MSKPLPTIPRVDKALFEATRPYAEESLPRSWWVVGSTFGLLLMTLTIAIFAPWWSIQLATSVMSGLLLVRAFILYHDFLHGSLLKGSRLARWLFFAYGMAALTPPRYWQRSHNFHHANVGKSVLPVGEGFSLLTSDIGAYPLMTTSACTKATSWQRCWYRLNRHPLTVMSAYLTVFLFSLTIVPLAKDPRKNWQSVFALLAHFGVMLGLAMGPGLQAMWFGLVVPFAIASAMGAYLFFAQHNFEGVRIVPLPEWNHFRGALQSSSFMEMGPLMRWITGNIGFHHIHHLNSLIPFYRLPEAMAAIPELQNPVRTSLHPRDIITSFRLNLWSVPRNKLVRYSDATLDESLQTVNELRTNESHREHSHASRLLVDVSAGSMSRR